MLTYFYIFLIAECRPPEGQIICNSKDLQIHETSPDAKSYDHICKYWLWFLTQNIIVFISIHNVKFWQGFQCQISNVKIKLTDRFTCNDFSPRVVLPVIWLAVCATAQPRPPLHCPAAGDLFMTWHRTSPRHYEYQGS